MKCIFCDIINKRVKKNFFYVNKNVVVFDDIKPKATIHKLIVPKIHISTLKDINKKNVYLISDIFFVCNKISKLLNLKGYKLIWNCNKEGGQEIFHLHCHFINYKNDS